MNKPSGKGPRLVIVHAITEDGWVNGADLIFEAKKRSGDYHDQMNWDTFSDWFRNQLLPNIPSRSLIVMDNAKYHNVLDDDAFPTPRSKKVELQAWLTLNHYQWQEDMLKPELFELGKKYAPPPKFQLDGIAQRYGHTILRTPPYHPELQPIEKCWGIVKNHCRDHCDFTMKNLHKELSNGMNKVTQETCKSLIKDIYEEEEKFWQ